MTGKDSFDRAYAEHRRGHWQSYFRLLKEAALLGYPEAQGNLGSWYLEGHRLLPRSPRKGAELLEAAARSGNALAAFDLGNCYADGLGVSANAAASRKWLVRAAQQGVSMAAVNLAVDYRLLGNLRAELRWLRRAMALGDEEATIQLGERALANRWSAQLFQPVARELLRLAAPNSQDSAAARNVLSKAASQGRLDPWAAARLAKMVRVAERPSASSR